MSNHEVPGFNQDQHQHEDKYGPGRSEGIGSSRWGSCPILSGQRRERDHEEGLILDRYVQDYKEKSIPLMNKILTTQLTNYKKRIENDQLVLKDESRLVIFYWVGYSDILNSFNRERGLYNFEICKMTGLEEKNLEKILRNPEIKSSIIRKIFPNPTYVLRLDSDGNPVVVNRQDLNNKNKYQKMSGHSQPYVYNSPDMELKESIKNPTDFLINDYGLSVANFLIDNSENFADSMKIFDSIITSPDYNKRMEIAYSSVIEYMESLRNKIILQYSIECKSIDQLLDILSKGKDYLVSSNETLSDINNDNMEKKTIFLISALMIFNLLTIQRFKEILNFVDPKMVLNKQ